AIDDDGERIDWIAIDEDRHLHEVAFLIALDVIVEAGIAAGNRFQAVVEIEYHFVERQLVDQHRARAGIGEFDLATTAVFAKLKHRTQIFVGYENGGFDPRLFDEFYACDIGHVGRVVQLLHRAVVHVQTVNDAGRRGDKVEIEFAFQPFADDLQMQKAQEAAAKAEAQGRRGFGFVGETRIVQMQL